MESHAAIVTGASGGIGRSIALELARLGYSVAITGRNERRMKEVENELEQLANSNKKQQKFLSIQADFEHMDQVDRIVPLAVGVFGRLDLLINNAGYLAQARGFFEDQFFADFSNVIQVNLMAACRLAQLAAPHLIKSPSGLMINVSSILDQIPMAHQMAYCVSKAALSMLTKTLANVFAGKNVRVLTLAPGPIRTNIDSDMEAKYAQRTLANRIGECDEVAKLVAYLVSSEAQFISGSRIVIDGGLSVKFG